MIGNSSRRLGLAALASGLIATTAPAFAVEQGDWLVRLRGIGVFPTDESGGISPDLLTSELQAQPAYMPELDFTYMATDNIGIELILATTPHDVDGKGAISGLGEAADTWLLPPALLVQWHFLPESRVRPYLGAGINYTITDGEDASSSLEGALGGPTKVKLDNSVGWALQAGMDVGIDENWFVNMDVKYIDLDVAADVTTAGTKRTTEVEINPIIVGLGVGYRF